MCASLPRVGGGRRLRIANRASLRQRTEDRGQRTEVRGQRSERRAFCLPFAAMRVPSSRCPLSSDFCPLSSDFCPLSSDFCPLTSVLCLRPALTFDRAIFVSHLSSRDHPAVVAAPRLIGLP